MSKPRQGILGFSPMPNEVQPGDSITLSVVNSVPCKIHRIVMPSKHAKSFDIIKATIAGEPMWQISAGVTGIPASIFNEANQKRPVGFGKPLKPNDKIEIILKNISQEIAKALAAVVLNYDESDSMELTQATTEKILLRKANLISGDNHIACKTSEENHLSRFIVITKNYDALRVVNIEVDGHPQVVSEEHSMVEDIGMPAQLFAPEITAPYFVLDSGKEFAITVRNLQKEDIQAEIVFLTTR